MAFISIVGAKYFREETATDLVSASLVALFGNIGSAQPQVRRTVRRLWRFRQARQSGRIQSVALKASIHTTATSISITSPWDRRRGGAQTGSFLELDTRTGPSTQACLGGKIVDTPGPNRWTQKPAMGRRLVGRQSGADSWDLRRQPHHMQTLTRSDVYSGGRSEYEFRINSTNGQPAPEPQCASSGASRGTVFITADGTAALFLFRHVIYDASSWRGQIFPSGYLMLRDGTRFRIDGGNVTWMRDRNGKVVLSFTYDASHAC